MDKAIRIHKLLLPLSWLYGAAVALRNALFDRNLLRSEAFPVPVISIGNLSAGGTGKTPHTEYLIRLLSEKYRIAVLSRGYKRETKGFVLADETATARTLGDEPFQMFRKFPAIRVAVDSNRRRGIRRLLDLPDNEKPEVILLDDAFQHRYVKPSLSILLTDSRKPFFDDCLLPAGRLREPAKNCRRADMFIFTKCQENTVHHPSLDKPVFYTAFEYKDLLPVFPAVQMVKKETLERLKKEHYALLLVAGLADPSDLIRYLQLYTEELHTVVFSDHHRFSRKEMGAIAKTFKSIENSRKMLITSEKDAVRLMSHPAVPEEIKQCMYYLPVEVVFHPEQEKLFTQKIEDHVKNVTRNRIVA